LFRKKPAQYYGKEDSAESRKFLDEKVLKPVNII
jgi:hypothetical protein